MTTLPVKSTPTRDISEESIAYLPLFALILGVSLTLLISGNLWFAGAQLAWYLTRASGALGYLFMASSTIWGLLLSSKVTKKIVSPAIALAMHNYLSWTAIGLSVFHAGILLFDSYYTYTIADLLIPFTGPYAPFWVGLGIIGLYISLLASLSFYMRQWLGQKVWRRLHYLTFFGYFFITAHGWMAGTDAVLLGGLYLGSSLAVLFLTLYRILAREK